MAVTVDEDRKDHLTEVRSVILAEAVAAERLPTRTLKVQAGGVHEHQVEPRKQIAPIRKQLFFDNVLGTAWRKGRATLLVLVGQFLAQPRHCTVEMMQLQIIDAGDSVIIPPAIRGAIGAADEYAVQHGEEHGALQGKAVLALACEFRSYRATASILPEALEHERGPHLASCDLRCLVGLCRRKNHGLGGKARTRLQ